MATSSVEEREVKIRMRKPLNAALNHINLLPTCLKTTVELLSFFLIHLFCFTQCKKMPRRGCTWWTSFALVAVEFPASSQKQGQKFLRLTSYLACRSRSGNFWKYWSCSPVRSRFLSRLCGIVYCNNRNVSQKSAD